MGKPSERNCVAIIEHGDFSIRLARVGQGPLVQVWVHEAGRGGRGIILDVEDSEFLIEAYNDLLDDIEGKTS